MADRLLSDVLDDLDDATSLRFLAQTAKNLDLDPRKAMTLAFIAVHHLKKYGRLCSHDALADVARLGECVCPTDDERHPVQCPQHPDADRRRRELARLLTGAVQRGLLTQGTADRVLGEAEDGGPR